MVSVFVTLKKNFSSQHTLSINISYMNYCLINVLQFLVNLCINLRNDDNIFFWQISDFIIYTYIKRFVTPLLITVHCIRFNWDDWSSHLYMYIQN